MTSRERPVAPPPSAYVTIDGRRWRASDPQLPAGFRQELVDELMAARRAVRDAADASARRAARARVHDAKLALGERGHPWWLPPTPAATARRIEAAILALLRSRGGASICPSDAARIAGAAAWRALLPAVRSCAVAMSARGAIDILRGGRVVTRDQTSGVLRYRLTRTADGSRGAR